MSDTLYILFISLISAQYFIVKKIFSTTGMQQWLIVLNSLLWFYGLFFLWLMSASSAALIGFAGGLNDLVYFLILLVVLLLHPVVMLILLYTTPKKTFLLWIPLLLLGFTLLTLHLKAMERAQSNDFVKSYSSSSDNTTENTFQSDSLSAERGDMEAQYILAYNYYSGENGVKQNDSIALKWFRLSAEQGNYMAQWFMASAYYNGTTGLKQNYAEAVKWYRLMAEHKGSDGEYNLGICYLNGKGVVQNKDTAFHWLKLAARKGYEDAQQLLKEHGQEWEVKRHPDSIFHLPSSFPRIDEE